MIMMQNAAGTHQFLVTNVAGTSAASEPALITNPLVTTDPFNLGPITDGTMTVTWCGPPRQVANALGAPICYGGAKPSQLSTSVVFAGGAAVTGGPPASFGHYSGCFNNVVGYSTSKVYGVSATTISASPNVPGNYLTGANHSSSCEFMTDAQLIAFDNNNTAASSGYTTGLGISIEVDSGNGYRRLFDGVCTSVTGLSAPNGFILLDFRSTSMRINRKIRISPGVVSGNGNFYGRFYVTPQDQVSFVNNPNRYKLAIIGDSIQADGGGYTLPRWSPPDLFADLVGCDDYCSDSVAGTGFISTFSGAQVNYQGRAQDIITYAPDVILIAGAYNDNTGSNPTYTSAQRIAAMVLLMQTFRQALPSAMIIMEGTWPGQGLLQQAQVEQDQITAVAQFADANTFFLPVQTDPTPWITGNGRLNSTTGTGNADIYVWTDGLHPSPVWGAMQVARRRANAFKNLILSLSKSP
jgi:lysophospholipase L1-like esterase